MIPIEPSARRILIVGSAGAGKSTLARRLAAILGLPVIHLDAHFWKPGWEETPRDVWKERVASLIEGERWIMDGNYSGTLEERTRACDAVILLALPRVQCMARVFWRAIRHYGRARRDLNPGCPEQWPSADFLRWIWTYPTRSLPKVMKVLEDHGRAKQVVVLRSSAEVRRFLSTIAGSGQRQ